MSKRNQNAWKRVYNQKKPYEKAKQFKPKRRDTLHTKLITYVFFPIIICLFSIWLFFEQAYISSAYIWLFLPLIFFLLVGTLKNRVLNSLPLVILGVYILYGIETGMWEAGTTIFFLVPLGSLVLKPKTYPIQYSALGVAILVYILDFLAILSLPLTLVWILIIVIYLLFLPPFIVIRIETFLEKQSQ